MSAVDDIEEEPKYKFSHIGDYQVGKTLGQGSFGKVKLGIHMTTKKKVALKLIEHSQASQKDLINIEREVKIMKLLDHPNIVKLFDVIEVEERKVTCLVLEYIEGGELFDYIVANRRLREPEATRFFRQIVSAMEYCHSNMVIHRDLKPENLLLDHEKNIKINDFGLSNVMKPGSFLETYCGSPLYSSPEIIRETNYMGPEVDIWALGVILYAMVTGYLPWDGDTVPQQVKNAEKANYEVPAHVSAECKHLISRMLTVDPKKRATIAEVRVHPWVNKGYSSPPPSCLPVRQPLKPENVDPTILKKLEDLGFNKDTAVNDLADNKLTSQSVVFYYLLLDQKQKSEPASAQPAPRRASLLDGGQTPTIVTSDTSDEGQTTSPLGNNRPKSMNITGLNLNVATATSTTGNGSPSPPGSPVVGSPHSGSPVLTPMSPRASPKSKNPILSIFKKKEGADKKTYRGSYDPDYVASATSDIENDKLRVTKGAFATETTTNKPLEEIQMEIERTLQKMNLEYKRGKKGVDYKVKLDNRGKPVKLEIEICKVEKMEGMKGIKFKRAKGDTWEYKNLFQSIIGELKL